MIQVSVKMKCYVGEKLLEPDQIVMINEKDFNPDVFEKVSEKVQHEKPKASAKVLKHKDEDVI